MSMTKKDGDLLGVANMEPGNNRLFRRAREKLSVIKKERMQPNGNVEGGMDRVKKGGVMLDFGCQDGEVGVGIGSIYEMRVVQADIGDERDDYNKCEEFILLDQDTTPDFGERKFDVIMLIDVLDKIGYSGYSPAEAKMELLHSLANSLSEGGVIVIGSTVPANNNSLTRLGIYESICNDSLLQDCVAVGGDFAPKPPKKLIEIGE